MPAKLGTARTRTRRQRPEAAWPADRVERWPLTRLLPYANNARLHTDEQAEQFAKSMHELGWTNPILVDEAGELIAGHGRVLAAPKLGWTEAPSMTAAAGRKRRSALIGSPTISWRSIPPGMTSCSA
jgi:hypothetical protein